MHFCRTFTPKLSNKPIYRNYSSNFIHQTSYTDFILLKNETSSTEFLRRSFSESIIDDALSWASEVHLPMLLLLVMFAKLLHTHTPEKQDERRTASEMDTWKSETASRDTHSVIRFRDKTDRQISGEFERVFNRLAHWDCSMKKTQCNWCSRRTCLLLAVFGCSVGSADPLAIKVTAFATHRF